jgi:hypothetical protein
VQTTAVVFPFDLFGSAGAGAGAYLLADELRVFVERGFRVLPASWHKLDASKALIEYSLKQHSPQVLGHLFTTWGRAKKNALPEYPPLVESLKLLKASKQ